MNNGTVTLVRRILATVSCPMQFHNYPFDKHECSFSFHPKRGQSDVTSLMFSTGQPREAGEFTVPNIWVITHGVSFSVARFVPIYMYSNTLPLVLITMTSIGSLWVDISIASARAVLSVVILLSMINFMRALEKKLPSIPYMTVEGYYATLCLFICILDVAAFIAVAHFKFEVGRTKRARDTPSAVAVSPKKSGDVSVDIASAASSRVVEVHENTPAERQLTPPEERVLPFLCFEVSEKFPKKMESVIRVVVLVIFTIPTVIYVCILPAAL